MFVNLGGLCVAEGGVFFGKRAWKNSTFFGCVYFVMGVMSYD